MRRLTDVEIEARIATRMAGLKALVQKLERLIVLLQARVTAVHAYRAARTG
jgi:hypothetical protein